MHTEHDTNGAASPFRLWFLTWELLFLAFLRQRTSYISYKKHVLKLCMSVSISDPTDCLSLLLCQQCLTEPFHLQGRLEPEKVPVAIRAAGVDSDGLWTKQNLAQIIWYFPLTTYKQHLSHSAIVLTSARQHHCALPPGCRNARAPAQKLFSTYRQPSHACAQPSSCFLVVQAPFPRNLRPGTALHQAQGHCPRAHQGCVGKLSSAALLILDPCVIAQQYHNDDSSRKLLLAHEWLHACQHTLS